MYNGNGECLTRSKGTAADVDTSSVDGASGCTDN